MNSRPAPREVVQFFKKEFNLKSAEMDKEIIREIHTLRI
jgi:hypothetical protein